MTRRRDVGALGVVVAVIATALPASAQSHVDLFNLSIEELMKVTVTSVSRRTQAISEAAAAVFVITQEDIRRSGASSLPELLRMAPGVHVARYSNSKWSVTARGMGMYYSSRLLVLIDGRSIYTPDFAGVFWDLHEIPVDNIERIEVVRGPGGTMWGANAVNGVINVITKHAAETQGALAVVGTGTEERGLASFRYGGHLGDRVSYRIFGKAIDHAFESTDEAKDVSQVARGGLRVDYEGRANDFMFQGDAFTGDQETPLTLPTVAAPYTYVLADRPVVRGVSALGQWTRAVAPDSTFIFRAYIDRYTRNEYIHTFTTSAADVDALYTSRIGQRHAVTLGGGFRATVADIGSSDVMRYNPGHTQQHLVSAIAQDEIALPANLALTVRTKVEHRDPAGTAIEPNVRLSWRPAAEHHLWGAISQNVRTPSLADQNARFDFDVWAPSPATRGLPLKFIVAGDPRIELETIVGHEIGYRAQVASRVAFDVTAFYNRYLNLSSYRRGPATLGVQGGIPHLVIVSTHENRAKGRTYGMEAVATWTPTSRLSLTGTSTLFQADLTMDDPALEEGRSLTTLLMSPNVQFTAGSLVQLTRDVDVSATVYSVGPWQTDQAPGFTRTDVRTGWRITPGTTLDVGVQNVFDERHLETALHFYETAREIRRSAYARLAWRF